MTYKQFVQIKKNDKFYHFEDENKYREFLVKTKDCVTGIVWGVDSKGNLDSFKYTDVQIEEPSSTVIV